MRWLTRWLRRRSSAAGSCRRAGTQLRLEALERRDVPTVTYYGGNVLPHVEAQALYLGNEWSSAATAGVRPGTLDNYLGTLTGGAYMDALGNAGYNVGRGTDTAGAIDGRSFAAGSTVSDASIQSMIQADIRNGLLQPPDANRLYVVYVEPNVAVNLGAGQGTTQQGILGYHGAFGGVDANGNAATIRYAVVAYPGGAARNSTLPYAATAQDQLTAVTSHELAEAVTDPDVNYAQLGWYDRRRGEIGDIEENNASAYVRLHGFLVQEVAGRSDQLLLIPTTQPPPTPPPAPPPTQPPSSTTATTTTIHAGPVHYYWYGPATEQLTVTVSAGSGVVPGGSVALIYGGRVLGTAPVQIVNGVATATFSVEYWANGSYTFSAEYLGSGPYQASTSNGVTVNV